MSVRESTSAAGRAGAGREPSRADIDPFTHPRGLLRLSLGVVLAPVVALINQQLIYSVNMWACGRGTHQSMHIVPALCLIVALYATWTAYSDRGAVGRGVEDEAATIETRTRFVSLLGIFISLFSALIIVAQWAAIFVFDPCMRA